MNESAWGRLGRGGSAEWRRERASYIMSSEQSSYNIVLSRRGVQATFLQAYNRHTTKDPLKYVFTIHGWVVPCSCSPRTRLSPTANEPLGTTENNTRNCSRIILELCLVKGHNTPERKRKTKRNETIQNKTHACPLCLTVDWQSKAYPPSSTDTSRPAQRRSAAVTIRLVNTSKSRAQRVPRWDGSACWGADKGRQADSTTKNDNGQKEAA